MFKEAERKCLKKLKENVSGNVSGSETFHAETGTVFCQPALFFAKRPLACIRGGAGRGFRVRR